MLSTLQVNLLAMTEFQILIHVETPMPYHDSVDNLDSQEATKTQEDAENKACEPINRVK